MQLVSGLSWARSSFDLPGLDMRAGPERVLVAAERRIGHAVEPAARARRHLRHFDRGAQPAPGSDNRRCNQREQSGRNAHLAIPRGTLPPRLRLSRPGCCQARPARYDLTVAAPKPWPVQAIIRCSILAAGLPAALITQSRRPRQSPRQMGRSWLGGQCRVAGRIRPAVGGTRPDRPNNQSDHGLCLYAYRRRRLGRGASCCLRQPRCWPRARTPRPAPGRSTPRPTPKKDGQRKIDEFAEAAKLLGGPAAHPECVWLGRRVVSLMWRDDLDTAFRHLDLYDRFGCPAGHIQATFRCLVRQGNIDPKPPETLAGRVHTCWINPNLEGNADAPRVGRRAGRVRPTANLYRRSDKTVKTAEEQFCT